MQHSGQRRLLCINQLEPWKDSVETVARLKPVLTRIGSDGEFWADAIETEDHIAPNSPANLPAQNIITSKDIRVDNPNTEERLLKRQSFD
jgi:hypothetical protein